jgi:hypothetical protein
MLPKKQAFWVKFYFRRKFMAKYSLFIFSVSFWPVFTQKKPETDEDLRAKTCLEIQH